MLQGWTGGPPPIETPEGWLIIYHGVRTTASGNLYRVGLALLDLDEPWKSSADWMSGYSATEPYERVGGDVPGVTFPTGIVVDKSTGGELKMYYGAADTTICVATANVDDLVKLVLSSDS